MNVSEEKINKILDEFLKKLLEKYSLRKNQKTPRTSLKEFQVEFLEEFLKEVRVGILFKKCFLK